jgi:GPH family glycoside/pentoside/hexuronide:cation symporter
LVFGFFFMGNLFAVIVSISLASMIAEVVEASEQQTGRRSEGVLYAGNLFVQKCATGMGILLSGLIIDFAGLEAKADPTKVPASVVDTLTLIYIVMVLLLASVLAWRVGHFPITRDDHEERLRNLAERRTTA